MVNIIGDDVIKIVKYGLTGNVANFSMVCRKIVSKLKKSDPELASQLSHLLSEGSGLRSTVMPAPVDGDSRRKLVHEIFPVVLESAPVLSSKIAEQLAQVLLERDKVKLLLEAGLSPIKTLLLSGPPGVGKTMSAHWLASQLNLPLLVLDLSSVMSSLLGKTGNNIKSVIEYAKGFPCVLLLDEFDAVAKKRDDDRDVGELKRLVNVLLQSMDDWPASSLLIAATNHPGMLDPAVWRRFELIIDFDNPDSIQIKDYLQRHDVETCVAERIAPSLTGVSYANLNSLVNSSKKDSVLNDISFQSALLKAVAEKINKDDKNNARDIEILQHYFEGLSDRKIAELLGISHPTVGRVIKNVIGE